MQGAIVSSLLRLWILFIGAGLGWALYVTVFRYNVLPRLSILDTHQSLQVHYQKFENAALIRCERYGYMVFFDGQKVFVYGLSIGAACNEPYQTAYVVDLKGGNILGFLCVQPWSRVKEFFDAEKCPNQTLFIKNPDANFDVWSLLEHMSKLQIVNAGKYLGEITHQSVTESIALNKHRGTVAAAQ